MRKLSTVLVSSLLAIAASASIAQAAAPEREWTFLVFLNGNNNLDSFGALDINEMEKVGSTDQVNVVVQWASYRARTVKRLLVQKDNNSNTVTSPILQDMGRVDMGDYRSLVEFVRWGVENYPAKHYFIDVWNHGAGWHLKNRIASGEIKPTDISFDDLTGNHITTEQLGTALSESAKIIGHKVDLYGSDACLMAMAEVAGEMSESVAYSVGSEEVEPGEGWPYDALLAEWTKKAGATPADVAKILTSVYLKSYQNGSQGRSEVTLSAFDLGQTAALEAAIKSLGQKIMGLDAVDRRKVVQAVNNVLNFTYGDYGDLADFLALTEKAGLSAAGREDFRNALVGVRQAMGDYVIANATTSSFSRAGGLALWLPYSKSTLNNYANRYSNLGFNRRTNWIDALRFLSQDMSN